LLDDLQSTVFGVPHSPAFVGLFYLSANHRGTLTGVGSITKGLHSF